MNETEFRLEKVIRRKGDKLYDNSFNSIDIIISFNIII